MFRQSYFQSLKNNSFQGFVIKCINDCLPVQERKMTCKHLHCAIEVNLKCHRYRSIVDTLDHVIKDTCYDNEWNDIWELYIEKIKKRIKKCFD